MTILAWQRGGAPTGPAVVLAHDWAADASWWQDTGWVEGLEAAGLAVFVPDLPGHGESADVLVPPDTEPSAWTANAILADLSRLRVDSLAAVGYRMGALVAGHLAVRAPDQVRRLVIVGCDDGAVLERGSDVAAALRDPSAALWNADASAAVSRARNDRRHHLPTLAQWAESAAWPAAPRLGALRTPVLLAIGQDDPRRQRAPRLAALFHDGHLVTAPGDDTTAVVGAEMVNAVASFLSGT